ncbi:MAG TPA: hypothetical protein VH597_00265 [Verrucomicrobiae bacterium]|jgi:hypothetical protein|nr:hypothetical protein [Verrucomicrobiae bacterium]
MSVDREYTLRISTVAGNPAARSATKDVNDVGASGNENLNTLETHGLELGHLLQNLNDFLPGSNDLLRAAVELKSSNQSGILSALESIKSGTRAEGSRTPAEGQSDALPEFDTANDRVFSQPPNDLNSSRRNSLDADPAKKSGLIEQSDGFLADTQVRSDLANQVRQFQKAFQSQGQAMSQQDAADLLGVIRQLGEAFFQQAQNSVTKQEFDREKIALRRLIESKGK